jgi:exonuclease SbcD
VLIAGDIYKNRSPNPTHQREFAQRINQLCAAGIPVFILTGNHDISPSLGRAHSVEIFDILHVPGVTIADRAALHRIETAAGPLQIIALPWITRHGLLTREELHMASFSEIEAMLRRRIDAFLEHKVEELEPDIPAVLTIHGTIDGASYGVERSITLGQDLVLPRSVIAYSQIDYVAMGHIHRHQKLGEHPPIVYPGSIERIDFGERDEEKGCVLVELDRGATRWHFHKLAARPFISIEVDVRASSDPEARIATAIQQRDVQQAVVRVHVRATREQAALLAEEAIRQQLHAAQAFFIAAVVIEVEREHRHRLAGAEQEIMQGMTPRRALELYLQSRGTDPERITALLAAFDELQSAEG